MFLAGNHLAQFVNAGFQSGIINAPDQFLITGHQQQGTLRGDIGDEQAGKMISPQGAVRLECGQQFLLALPKLVKAHFFDLRHAEVFAVLAVFLAIGGDGLRRRFEREQ